MIHYHKKNRKDLYSKSLKELFFIPDGQLNYYTTLSAHFVRITVMYMNDSYASFLGKLPKAPVSKEDFSSTLKNYESSQLASIFQDLIFNLQFNEQGFTITWITPPHLTELACKHKEILAEITKPFHKLLDEINESSNSLSFDTVDGDKIAATIKLPYQDPPEYSEKEKREQNFTYYTFKSAITFDPCPAQAVFLISNGENSQFKLIISNSTASHELGRKIITNTLYNLDNFNTKKPITQLEMSGNHHELFLNFGEENDQTTVHLNSAQLLISRYQARISRIVDENTCHTFSITTFGQGRLLIETFENINRILKKAKKICNEKVNAYLKDSNEIIPSPILEITDLNGTLIGRLHSKDFINFGGRLCSKKLTKEVLTIFDNILDDAAEEDPVADLTDFLSNDFLVRLERYGIQPSEDYISFQRFLADPDNLKGTSALDSWLSIRNQIIRGDVFFEKKDGKIFIDAPKTPKEIIPFLRRHII